MRNQGNGLNGWLWLNGGTTHPTTLPSTCHLMKLCMVKKNPPLLSYLPFDSQLDLVDRSLQAREDTLRSLKSNLLKAQNGMKSHADKGRTDRSYVVGDWVYIKLRPYRQMSLKPHSCQKLSAKFFGPFEIIAMVGVVAYTLTLPPTAKLHPTFHISQLKRKIGSQHASVTLPIVQSDAGPVLLYPEKVLDRRMIQKNGRAVSQLLIQWLNSAPEDSTSEDFHSFTQAFPHFDP